MNILEARKEEYKQRATDLPISFLQSWEWGEIKEPTWRPVRLLIGDYPVTLLLRKLPFIRGSSFAYLPRFLSDETYSPEILNELSVFVKNRLKTDYLVWDPEITTNIDIDFAEKIGFRPVGHQWQIENTNVIDLSRSKDELWKALKSSTRNKCNRPLKDDCTVSVHDSGVEPLNRFWDIMQGVTKNTSYVMHSKDYYEKLWAIMTRSDMARIFLMSCGGRDVGTYFSIIYQDRLSELYGGLNTQGRQIRGAGYFLKWQSMIHAKSLGVQIYDQWGVAPKVNGKFQEAHPLSRIGQFKEEFGGRHVEYHKQHVLIINQSSYRIAQIMEYLQKTKLRLQARVRKLL